MKKISYFIKIDQNFLANEFVSDAKNLSNIQKEIEQELLEKFTPEQYNSISNDLTNLFNKLDKKILSSEKQFNVDFSSNSSINLTINHFGQKKLKNRIKNG